MRRTRTITTLAATGALLALAGPAHAAIVDQGVDEFSGPTGTVQCDGFSVSGTESGRVEYTLKERRPGGPVFWSGHASIDFTYTNDTTGRYWTEEVTFYEHDTKVLSQQDDVIEMLVTSAFRADVFDEAGEWDSFNRGMSQWVITIDSRGTTELEDDVVEFSYPVRLHGAFNVGDFCEDAVRFTTG
jgi:hypothetical protein